MRGSYGRRLAQLTGVPEKDRKSLDNCKASAAKLPEAAIGDRPDQGWYPCLQVSGNLRRFCLCVLERRVCVNGIDLCNLYKFLLLNL